MYLPTKLFNDIYNMNRYELGNYFEYIGEGISRVVYGVDNNFVVKVAKNKDGDLQCRIENFVYNDVNDRIRRYLCPILWYRKGMVVMPRAIPMTKFVASNVSMFDVLNIPPGSQSYNDLNFLSKKYDLLYEDIVSPTSWGLINRSAVLIDYGCPE